MVAIRPYLAVPNAKEALEAYKDVFGIEVRTHMPFEKEMGMQMGMPEDYDWENSTMHCEFDLDGSMIYMSDDARGGEPGAQKISVLLEIDSKEQIERFYQNVVDQGWEVTNELEKTFWGAWFASFTDSFGIGWQMNYQEDQMEG